MSFLLFIRLSNEKPSAIFRLRGSIISSNISNPFATRSLATNVSSITATLGISIEPINVVEEQIATLPQSNAAVPENASQITLYILKNLYNYVTSFASSVVPFGAQKIGTGDLYLSTKVFQDWYDGFMRKVTMNPNIVLKNESDNI